MPNSAAKRVIEAYLKQEAPGYALMVDAPWGSGKTHIVSQATHCKTDPTRLYVTLYDVDSAESFDWALVRAMNPWSDGARASWTKRFKELASGIQVFGNSVDLTKVNLTEIALRALPDTLIFDDIERCGLKHVQLSGLINRFIEHQNKRVILIANTDHHKEKVAFDDSREKLIGQTITLRPELGAAIAAFWIKIPNGQGRKILQDRQKLVVKTFEEAGHQNLRLLLRAMRDAAVTLNVLTSEMLGFDDSIDQLTATFLALHMAYHGGRLSKQDMHARGRYRSLPGSQADKDKSAFDALCAVQEDHPDCNIDIQNNQILPVELGYALIVDGYASNDDIVKGLLSTHQFSTPSEQPDWVRLWNWAEETEEELASIITRLTERLDSAEITNPGEVLQLYAGAKFMARQNAIGLNETGVAGYFRKYILNLAQDGKIPARVPSTDREGRSYGYRDESGTCGYGGYAFEINEGDRRIIDLMKAQQDEALARKMPEYASDLMGELSTDFLSFLDRFEHTSTGANFSGTPIFHYLDVESAVESFFKLFGKDKGEAQEFLKLLGKRRSEHRKELQEEWEWIDSFREAAIQKGRDSSRLLAAQVAQYFTWFLKTG